MVTRFVDNCCTMTEARFKDTGTVARAGQLLWRLHTGCPLFAKDFKLFDMIDEYKSLLEMKGAVLPKGYADMEVIANRARLALSKRSIPMRPCHCDPLCENFLDVKELDDNNAGKMYLIDYEYAGNNDPMWDLGDLSVEGHFSDDQDMELLHAYFSGPPPAEQVARMVIYKGLCDLLWTLWGVIQHSNGNPAEDFWLYAQNRFNRCHSLMSGDRFQQAVQTIERDDFCDTIT